jgi:hypothetical protein
VQKFEPWFEQKRTLRADRTWMDFPGVSPHVVFSDSSSLVLMAHSQVEPDVVEELLRGFPRSG